MYTPANLSSAMLDRVQFSVDGVALADSARRDRDPVDGVEVLVVLSPSTLEMMALGMTSWNGASVLSKAKTARLSSGRTMSDATNPGMPPS